MAVVSKAPIMQTCLAWFWHDYGHNALIRACLFASMQVTDSEELTPDHVLAADPQQLRAAGLSERKVRSDAAA
jgi:hypothetical protein